MASNLNNEKKSWLNSKLKPHLRKTSDFSFIDDYVFFILSDFDKLENTTKIYTTGSGGMGHIIVVKRDGRNELVDYKMFDTGYNLLPPTHEYIVGYTDVKSLILQIKKNKYKERIANTPFSLN
jgi:hypothetical protein